MGRIPHIRGSSILGKMLLAKPDISGKIAIGEEDDAKGSEAELVHCNVVAHGQKTTATAARFSSLVEHAEKILQAIHLDVVEAIEEGSRNGTDRAYDGRRGKPPRQGRSQRRRRLRHDTPEHE
jgi:hypothetical protein